MKKLIAIAIGVALAGVGTVALAGRDSSGTMTFNSVAGGYPFQAGVISRSAMNAHFAELASEITDSASRSGKGGFTAPVRGADGTAAAPAFSFTGDTNTGLYRIGTDNVGISLGGTKKVDLASGLTAFTDPVSFAGSTTVAGVATFDSAVTFLSSVTVPTASASTDAVNKAFLASSKANLPVVDQRFSTSSGTYSTTNTSYEDVTNLSVTLTTTGRPVVVSLQPYPSDTTSGIVDVATGYAYIAIVRDGTVISSINVGSSSPTYTFYFTPSYLIIDPSAGAGSHTYKVQARVLTGATLQIYNCVLVAYEL